MRSLAADLPGRLARALGLTLAGSLTEGVGLLILVPLLHFVGLDVQQGTIGRLARAVETTVTRLGLSLDLVTILALYVVVVVVQAWLLRWQTVTSASLQSSFVAHRRSRLHRAITRADWLYLVRYRSSDLAHALTGQAQRVGHGVYVLLRMASDLVTTTAYVLATLWVSPPVTALVVSAGLALTFLLRRQARAATQLGQVTVGLGAETYRAVLEHLGGIKTVRTYDAGELGIRRFDELTQRVARTEVQTTSSQADARRRFDVGAVVVLGAVLYLAIAIVHASASSILFLLYAFARVMPRVSSLQGSLQQLLNVLPDFSALAALEADLLRHQGTSPAGPHPVHLHRSLRLEGVSFRYQSQEAGRPAGPALTDVDLTIAAGRTTAIVGPSGSGKTTLADLLVGLIAPQQGQILVDDAPLAADRVAAWRTQIGYVPQETFLFHDTVRANLAWVRPEAGEAELREALAAAAADFVDRLPAGLDTVIGDRGVLLSGGERQRLALARALLRRPTLLILDEATSNLDAESERRVQDAIDRLHGRLTVVVITHRLAAVRSADRILVLDQGRLVESGDWHTLLTGRPGRFRALCEAQGLALTAG